MMTATGHAVTATANRLQGDHLGMPRAWSVTLRYRGRSMRVRFGQGSAHTEAPLAGDVLECLLSDAAGYENSPAFEDWASEYGYDDDDSREAERTFRAVGRQTERLRSLLGDDYEALVWGEQS